MGHRFMRSVIFRYNYRSSNLVQQDIKGYWERVEELLIAKIPEDIMPIVGYITNVTLCFDDPRMIRASEEMGMHEHLFMSGTMIHVDFHRRWRVRPQPFHLRSTPYKELESTLRLAWNMIRRWHKSGCVITSFADVEIDELQRQCNIPCLRWVSKPDWE
jgi:hypothetical protein